MNRIVLAVLVAAAVATGQLDFGEFLVDTAANYLHAPEGQESPALAFDGENFLVVWPDYRIDVSSRIFAARISPQGALLDSGGIQLSQVKSDQTTPDVAFDGDNYFVVWADNRNGDLDVYGTRVSPSGGVLDPDGLAICTWAHNQEGPAVCFNGEAYLVAWTDRRWDDHDIYAARVSPDGTVLDPGGFLVNNAAERQMWPAASRAGSDFLVVWTDERSRPDFDIYGTLVAPDGRVRDSIGFVVASTPQRQQHADVAFDGTNCLVAWEDSRVGFADIYGTRVTTQGHVLDSAGIAICSVPGSQIEPHLTYDGNCYLLAWSDERIDEGDVFGARVSPAGVVLDPLGIALSTEEWEQALPSVAAGQSGFLVAWEDWRLDGPDIFGTRVSTDGSVLDPAGLEVSTAANTQSYPAVGSDGTDYLIAWQDERLGRFQYDVYCSRVTADGQLPDGEPVPLATHEDLQRYADMAYTGENYLVVWADHRDECFGICGGRVTPQGVALDPGGLPFIAGYTGRPAVASDGVNSLVVSVRDFVVGARVSSDVQVLDTIPFLIGVTPRPSNADVAFDSVNYLVVWDADGGRAIHGNRVSTAGHPLDVRIDIAQSSGWAEFPRVAFDGSVYLVVWHDSRNGNYDIYGARIRPDGTVLDSNGFAISTAESYQVHPDVAFDGAQFLVVWSERESEGFDIAGARVTASGQVLDTFEVSRMPGDQEYPVLAHGLAGQILLAYEGWATTVSSRHYGASRIWGKLGPIPGIEEQVTLPARQEPVCGRTIVRGILRLPAAEEQAELINAVGQRMMRLDSGENDVSGVAPGVYFVRYEGRALTAGTQIRKVVLAR